MKMRRYWFKRVWIKRIANFAVALAVLSDCPLIFADTNLSPFLLTFVETKENSQRLDEIKKSILNIKGNEFEVARTRFAEIDSINKVSRLIISLQNYEDYKMVLNSLRNLDIKFELFPLTTVRLASWLDFHYSPRPGVSEGSEVQTVFMGLSKSIKIDQHLSGNDLSDLRMYERQSNFPFSFCQNASASNCLHAMKETHYMQTAPSDVRRFLQPNIERITLITRLVAEVPPDSVISDLHDNGLIHGNGHYAIGVTGASLVTTPIRIPSIDLKFKSRTLP